MDLLDELWREVFEHAASKELAYFSSRRRAKRRLPRPSSVLRLVSRRWKVLADPLFFRVISISEPPSPKVTLVAHVLANQEYCSDIARCTWRVRIGMAFDPEGMDETILAYLDHLAAFLARTRRLRRLEVELNQAPPTVAMISALSTSAAASLTYLIIPMGKNFRDLMSCVGSFHQLEVLSLSYVLDASDFVASAAENHSLESVPEWQFGRLGILSIDVSHCKQIPAVRQVFGFLLRCALPVLRVATINCTLHRPEHMAELRDFLQRQAHLSELRLSADRPVSDSFAAAITAQRLRLHGMPLTPAALLQLARQVSNIELYLNDFDHLMNILYALSTAPPDTLRLRRLKLGMWRYRPLWMRTLTARLIAHAHKLKERGISLVDCGGKAVIDIDLTHDTARDVIASPTVPAPILMS